MERAPPICPACTGAPSVVVSVRHRALRQMIAELLLRDDVDWRIYAVAPRQDLAACISAAAPKVVVLDDGDLMWRRDLPDYPSSQIIVIGPEPDPSYEQAARRAGAGGWVSQDRVSEDLVCCMRRVVGCAHATPE